MTTTISATPASLGYRMPAEWEPHEATWISWPHREKTWPGAFEKVPGVFVQIVRAIAESELVRINVGDPHMAKRVKFLLEAGRVDMNQVRFHYNPTNDTWCRDHGPIYVVRNVEGRRERAIVDWDYNAWGGKYPPYDSDNSIPRRIADEFIERRFSPGIVLEGGSIDVNGEGTLLTTEACLLNQNRNPHLTREEIEQTLRDFLAVRKILWLGDGIVGDDTDGHVDDITRFVSADTIVTVIEENPADPNFHPLRENYRRLLEMTDHRDRPLNIVKLPMPSPSYANGIQLPASYANFLICNTKVVVPIYGCSNDEIALGILQEYFPGRKVVGINCTPLVWGLGSIHCITQQQPSGVSAPIE
ncbi:Putative agmatine deiminase [Planctomyces sp. SH-PL14]|nr:Putative agmatine deiminase [Planctomyces sp. SH-PL14]